MSKRKSSRGVLIAVELGADWPTIAEFGAATARRVLAQDEGESPAHFAARIGERLDGLFARGVELGTAVVACNERLDQAAQSARSEFARMALGAMAKRQQGALFLSASERSSERLRHALSTLASELDDEWRRARVSVKVRIGDESVAAPPAVSVSVDAPRGKVGTGARKVA
ncbi:MAG TPA: hypothetical protein VHV51_10150 [Polyangiaceae bacterium]|jgi:hypothetical protein|nr:hypothetical protein [Polyangiaceae bacterium]